ncbi:MAG: coiled-coil domain-containing protein, partial [Collinsella sp.]
QQIHDELSAQTQELDQTAGEITQKQQEIAEGQAKLSSYVAGEYKTGGLSLLQVLTGVDDLGDMLNRLFYYGKVSDKQAQTIQEVKDLKQQLTDKQAEQEKNVAATQKKVAAGRGEANSLTPPQARPRPIAAGWHQRRTALTANTTPPVAVALTPALPHLDAAPSTPSARRRWSLWQRYSRAYSKPVAPFSCGIEQPSTLRFR